MMNCGWVVKETSDTTSGNSEICDSCYARKCFNKAVKNDFGNAFYKKQNEERTTRMKTDWLRSQIFRRNVKID